MSEAGHRTRRKSAAAPERNSAKDVLIDAGEQLFGRHGLDGISLREIALAAGQANTAAVHYHFKSRAGLVLAILDNRLEKIERLRCEQLQNLSADDRRNPRSVLRLNWLPSMAIRNAAGSYTFCRFLLQYMLHPDTVPHPVASYLSASGTRELAVGRNLACSAMAVELLAACCGRVPAETFYRRLRVLSLMFLSAVVEYDNRRLLTKGGRCAIFDVDPILDMAIAALAAPP
jgi:AcrR family transcriptional regulator